MIFHNIFSKEKIENEKPIVKYPITIDNREQNPLILRELEKNFIIKFEQLAVADYLLGNGAVAVERKTVSDFLSSMTNKRLFAQLEEIKQYPLYLLIIEGIEEQHLYAPDSHINENAVRGFLLSILLTHQVPILFTKNSLDTAQFLLVLAKRLEKKPDEVSLRYSKTIKTQHERKQFILEGFPGIGPKTAKALLKEFGSIKNIINAPEEQLQKVLGKKYEVFRKLLD